MKICVNFANYEKLQIIFEESAQNAFVNHLNQADFWSSYLAKTLSDYRIPWSAINCL
jgi:hypothetical protein